MGEYDPQTGWTVQMKDYETKVLEIGELAACAVDSPMGYPWVPGTQFVVVPTLVGLVQGKVEDE